MTDIERSKEVFDQFRAKYDTPYSIGDLTATVCTLCGLELPQQCAGTPIPAVIDQGDKLMDGVGKTQKVVLFCADALGEHQRKHYADDFARIEKIAGFRILSTSVMPSVTPVCYGSIFSGAAPCVHGIEKYEKPVLKIDTMFDAFARAGKNVAICAINSCSIDMIFRKRNVDYYSMQTDARCREMTERLLREDDYDMIICYSTDYDHLSHHTGCDSEESVTALKNCVQYFEDFARLTDEIWANYNHTLVWAPDHGNHPISENSGTHGTNTPEDMLVNHFYKITPAK